MRELGFRRVLFLVHRGQLARQTKKSYEKIFDKSVSMGLVGVGNRKFEFCREENRNRMRRSDREVKDFDGIIRIMEKCDVCRIALNNNGYPYILPLNFGMKVDNNIVELYFHGANEGMKYDLIQNDNRASFEMDCEHRLVTELERGSCTMEYESVIGKGYIEILPEEEKYDALCILMKHYHQETFPFNKSVMPHTTVFKLVVENMTGKVSMKRNDK